MFIDVDMTVEVLRSKDWVCSFKVVKLEITVYQEG